MPNVFNPFKSNCSSLADTLPSPPIFDIVALVHEHEERVIKQVLAQLFKREVTMEDAKRCAKLYQQGEDGYSLAVDGVVVGRITYGYPLPTFLGAEIQPPTFSVKFEPSPLFK